MGQSIHVYNATVFAGDLRHMENRLAGIVGRLQQLHSERQGITDDEDRLIAAVERLRRLHEKNSDGHDTLGGAPASPQNGPDGRM